MRHALKFLPQEKQNEVLNLMAKASRAKYRAALFDGDYQPLSINVLDFWFTAREYLIRAVNFEDLREVEKKVDSQHIHLVKLKDEEIESVDSKTKIIKQ